MKLRLRDKFLIGSILPQKSDITTMSIVIDINDKVKVTQKEIVEYEIKGQDNKLAWNEKGAKAEIEIDFTGTEIGVLKDAIKELDKKKEITLELFELAKKIKDM